MGQQVRVGVLLRIGGGRAPARASRPYTRPYPCGINPPSAGASGKKAILQRVRVCETRLIRPWLSASSGRIKNWYYFKYQIVKTCYSSKTYTLRMRLMALVKTVDGLEIDYGIRWSGYES